ncbi:hypothetical protein [Streptomyces lunaelactis]|uniref:hypothetical protein n=1 Tax=Streptomyces lunaelactis TaxID=1535768 RepID=UPI00158494EA|nr:hypothetical protein [Streptomyces lunaelactis]NUK22076.1 hypothetical protein [Streptomyces lunaelactis]
MPLLAGQIFKASQANHLRPTKYSAVGTGTLTGAVSNTDVPDATITLTTETDGAEYSAWCVWDVDLSGATTGLGFGRLNLDGSNLNPLSTYAQEVTTDRLTVPQNYRGTIPTAGTHTFKLVATLVANQQILGVNTSILVEIAEVV